MQLMIQDFEQAKIAVLESDLVEIHTADDMLDLIGNANYQGAHSLVIHERNLCPEFFDLSTRIAGEILQKFSNYRMRLAIVGDFSNYTSKSLRDFIYESNKTGRILFIPSHEEAIRKLTA
jgi:hypothetical protein